MINNNVLSLASFKYTDKKTVRLAKTASFIKIILVLKGYIGKNCFYSESNL